MEPLRQAHRLQGRFCPLPPFLLAHTGVKQRQSHIVQGRHLRQEVEVLEHKADVLIPDLCQLVIVQGAHILVFQDVLARGWQIQAAHQVHERGLSRAGRAHNGNVVPLLHLEIHIFQHRYQVFAPSVVLTDVA